MTLEEMRRKKAELGYTNERIAQLSGVPLSTVQKVFAGVTRQPRYETLMALERVLGQGADRLCETEFEYKTGSGTGREKKQGEYTVEDYYALPDDRRVELIHGIIYDMASPTSLHQALVYELSFAIKSYIKVNKGKCFSGSAPLDFRLLKDEKTMVQPDVFVVCDENKITKTRIEGAPDLAMEILSEGNKFHDLVVKLAEYRTAGVREYWIVDPEEQKIIVYNFEADSFPRIYGFQDKIPVHIFEDKCVIDMSEVYEKIHFFYDM